MKEAKEYNILGNTEKILFNYIKFYHTGQCFYNEIGINQLT